MAPSIQAIHHRRHVTKTSGIALNGSLTDTASYGILEKCKFSVDRIKWKCLGPSVAGRTGREDSMIRVLIIGSVLWIAQAVPASAEKATLACSQGTGYIIFYLAISSDANTVAMSNSYGTDLGTYPARITPDAVTWVMQDYQKQNYQAIYNRHTAILGGVPGFNGAVVPCTRAPTVY
jgi:hypothetical protein